MSSSGQIWSEIPDGIFKQLFCFKKLESLIYHYNLELSFEPLTAPPVYNLYYLGLDLT